MKTIILIILAAITLTSCSTQYEVYFENEGKVFTVSDSENRNFKAGDKVAICMGLTYNTVALSQHFTKDTVLTDNRGYSVVIRMARIL